MSEGSETENELDRLPDLAQELFPTIGEAIKKPSQPSSGHGDGSGGSGSGSQRSSMNLEKQQQGSPGVSPTSAEGAKFATVGASSGMEFAASRAVGKYRQRQAATNGSTTTINNRQSSHQSTQMQRADSLPPPRPPPPQRGWSLDGKQSAKEGNAGLEEAPLETDLVEDDDTTINYPTQFLTSGNKEEEKAFVSKSIDEKTSSGATSDEQVFHKSKLVEQEQENSLSERRESDATSIFRQIGMAFPTSISSPLSSTDQVVSGHSTSPFGQFGLASSSYQAISGEANGAIRTGVGSSASPMMTMTSADAQESAFLSGLTGEGESMRSTHSLPGELPIPMTASPNSHSPSPSGLTSSFPMIRTSPQSQNRTGLQHQSSLSNKSFGDSDMGSSSESARLSLSSKNRLDLPSQRTLSEEDDTRSTHSMRSSRVSSRRQSTEDSR
jgi:hypothetical protein